MLKRSTQNPILSREDIPGIDVECRDVSSVFNPGAIKFNDQYILLLRVQNRARETFLLLAYSNDGKTFMVKEQRINFIGIEQVKETIYHIYDPRISKIGNTYYIMFAMDMDGCCKLGLGKTVDFEDFEFMGIVSEEDNRNGVLFPEKVNDRYLRYDRPNKCEVSNGVNSGREIILSASDDLLNWQAIAPVFAGRWHYWDETIGAGPPPVKTKHGWLLVYHGIAGHFGVPIYQAGVALMDLKDPAKVITRGRYNILEPRELYEMVGQVPNVIFPSGMIVEEYDNEGFVKHDSKATIYYGAADTVIGMATTTIDELILAAFDYDKDNFSKHCNK